MKGNTFDQSKTAEYERYAHSRWNDTEVFGEYRQRTAGQSIQEKQDVGAGLMALFVGFGALKEEDASAPEAQLQVKALQDYISAHYYTCTNEMLARLGRLYDEAQYAKNIDLAGGEGTAAFTAEAIRRYCGE